MARKTIPYTCKGCGVIFHRHPRGPNRNIYCTNKCQAAHYQPEPLIDFFWRHTQKGDGCWLWTGPRHAKGYGAFRWNRRSYLAHRVSYELLVGEIPIDRPHVCHRCDVPLCVNPAHLFLGSHLDNMSDMTVKNRFLHKLTVEQVRAIRADNRVYRIISEEYGVGQSVISQIKSRQLWRHID